MQQLPAWRSEPLWLLAGLGVISPLILHRWGSPTLGEFVLILAALFLVQTLVRDLVILWKLRRGGGNSQALQTAHCYCLETPVGMLFLLLAIGVYWASPPGRLDGGWPMVGLGVGATMLINFLLRDLIIQWRPFAIRRDPAHFNIIPKI